MWPGLTLYVGKPNTDVGAFVDFQRPFSQAEFVETAQAFVAKYDGLERVLGPERTNAGWEWRSKFSLVCSPPAWAS